MTEEPGGSGYPQIFGFPFPEGKSGDKGERFAFPGFFCPLRYCKRIIQLISHFILLKEPTNENSHIILEKPQGLLVLSLVLVIFGSLPGMFNTSFYSVKVQEIKFQADHGTLSGLLYMPKGAGADDKRPVIITTHGYLNTKEMQDAPAIEMSRRGYIVLALDMYDHGDSRWSAPIPVKDMFGTFWIYSQFDAAKYIYDQDFTKKMIRVTHMLLLAVSMGGFSSLHVHG